MWRNQVWCFHFLYKWQVKQQAQGRKRNQPTGAQLYHQSHIPKGTCYEKTELLFRRPWILQNNEQQSKWNKNVNVPRLALNWQTTIQSKNKLDAGYAAPYFPRFSRFEMDVYCDWPHQYWIKCMIRWSDFPRCCDYLLFYFCLLNSTQWCDLACPLQFSITETVTGRTSWTYPVSKVKLPDWTQQRTW